MYGKYPKFVFICVYMQCKKICQNMQLELKICKKYANMYRHMQMQIASDPVEIASDPGRAGGPGCDVRLQVQAGRG